MSEMQYLRFKHFLRERQEFSQTGAEELLSVSEYYGIAPRSTVFDEDRKESRAESLEGYRIVKKGDFVMNYMLAWKGAYGISDHDGIVSPAYSVFEVDESIVDLKYLHYRARSKDMQSLFKSVSRGIMESRLRLYPESLLSLPIQLPKHDFQCRVSNYLDTRVSVIDTLIAKKTRFIELLKEKRQAVITKAVTKGLDDSVEMKDSGVEWLGSIPYHWKVVPLKHLLEGALQYGATESGEVFIEEWPRYIRITDIDLHGRLRSEGAKSLDPSIAEPYLIKKWDILFARSGATVGKSFIYEGEDYKACFAGYMIRASANPSLICSEYLYFYLQSHPYWEYIVGSQSQATIQNVSAEKYGALLVPLPPIEEQSRLLTFLKKSTIRLDELTSKTERSIELLKEKRSALITAAVTGKIDVREAA